MGSKLFNSESEGTPAPAPEGLGTEKEEDWLVSFLTEEEEEEEGAAELLMDGEDAKTIYDSMWSMKSAIWEIKIKIKIETDEEWENKRVAKW